MNTEYKISNIHHENLNINIKLPLIKFKKLFTFEDFIILVHSSVLFFKGDISTKKIIFLQDFILDSKEEFIDLYPVSSSCIYIITTNTIYKYDVTQNTKQVVLFNKIVIGAETNFQLFTSSITSFAGLDIGSFIVSNTNLNVTNQNNNNTNNNNNNNADTPILFSILSYGEDGNLFISRNSTEDKDIGLITVEVELVKKFFQKITKIELKKFNYQASDDMITSDNQSFESTYYLITIFTQLSALICLINHN